MAEGRWISYLRVSTDRQGASGLGIEAQRASVEAYLNGGDWKLIEEFVEIESGRHTDRSQLQSALQACRLHGAKLVIARLDRLSRDAHFLLGLDKAGVDFVAADMPYANRLTIGVMALVAEEERKHISSNTKAALQAAKARGKKLGGYRAGAKPTAKTHAASAEAIQRRVMERASDLAPTIKALQVAGATSLRSIAAGLNAQKIPTARGNGKWSATQVARALERI
jgi:DNA invertase Pin-like site-specific DNA recombinase